MDEKLSPTVEAKPFKLNYKRIFLIGFAFFGILLLWQVYDSWCPTFLTEQFKKALGIIADIPSDFDGIPIVNNQLSFLL